MTEFEPRGVAGLSEHPAFRRLIAAAVMIVVFAAICALAIRGDGKPPIGDARVTTEGIATVTTPGKGSRKVTSVATLHHGDIVEATEGAMTLELPNGSILRGRPNSPSDPSIDATKVQIGAPPELLAGQILAETPSEVSIAAAGNRLVLSADGSDGGAARITRSLAVGAGSYKGSVLFDSAGQERTVPALRELEVATLGRPPGAPRALNVSESDPWDRRLLGDTIDLGRRLSETMAAYSRSLAVGEGRTAPFFRRVLPVVATESGYTDDLIAAQVDRRSPGELLVASAIAGLGERGTFAERWKEIFAFKDIGATWGLVARDQGVAADPLLAAVRAAVDDTPFEFAEASVPTTGPPAPTSPNPSDDGTGTAAPIGPPTTSPSPTTEPPPTPTTLPLPPPATIPEPPPITIPPLPPPTGPDSLLDGLVEVVDRLLGGLLPEPRP